MIIKTQIKIFYQSRRENKSTQKRKSAVNDQNQSNNKK